MPPSFYLRAGGVLFAAALLLRSQLSGIVFPFAEGGFLALMLLAAALVLLGGDGAGGSMLRLGAAIPAAILLWGWSLLSLAWSTDPGQGAREGVALSTQVLAFLLAAHLLSRPRDGTRGGRGAWEWVAGAAVLAALLRALQQRFMLREETIRLANSTGGEGSELAALAAGWRAYGGFLNPNLMAGFCALALPLLLGLARARRGGARRVFFALALMTAAVLVLTGSLGGMLAAAAGVGCWFLLARRQEGGGLGGRREAVLLAAGATLALLLLFAVRGTGFLSGPDSSFGQRLSYWEAGMRMGARAPLWGHGLGSVPGALPGFAAPPARFANDPHDFLLRQWAAGGAAGTVFLLLFLAAWGRAVARGLSSARGGGRQDPLLPALAASAAAFLLHSLMDMDLSAPETAFFGWTVMGACLGWAPSPPAEDAASAALVPFPLRLAAAAAALLLCIPTAAFLRGETALFMGREELQEGSARAAAASFGRAGGSWPWRGEAALGAGRALAGAGDPAGAALALSRAEKELPLSPYPPWELARVQAAGGRGGDALVSFDRALVRLPASPRLRLEKARVLASLDRRDEAIALLREAEGLALLDPQTREAARLLRERTGG